MSFFDGLKNVINGLANTRNAVNNNFFERDRLPYDQCRAMAKTGIGSKVLSIKSGYAFDNTVVFENKKDQELFNKKIESLVIEATKNMLAYGRGIIVVHFLGDSLAQPLGDVNVDELILSVFSGDMISVPHVSYDIQSEKYLKPLSYVVRGHTIHHSRVVDFVYVKPSEYEAPAYQYGGVSEFEVLKDQMLNDGIIERASSSILEKSSNFVYKIKGFAEALRSGQDKQLIEYFEQVENLRSIYGAVVLDSEDDAVNVSQQLNNLQEVNEMSIRRLAMVTGIPVSFLVGEAVRGLNSSGDNEHLALVNTIKMMQKTYLTAPLNDLFGKLKMGAWSWSKSQGVTDRDSVVFDNQIIVNAQLLSQMGEDGSAYLISKGLTKAEPWDDFWSSETAGIGGEIDEQT